MTATRLSVLDDSFLAVESERAHMHVGWGALFDPPKGRPAPRFAELRDHVAARLCLAPRYRQRLAEVPLGLNAPLWIDDDGFDVNQQVVASSAERFDELVDECMSQQLRRDRPLWQLCIAERLDDGRIGVVGKAHHCMVDGIAAVELASLLLDPTPDSPPGSVDGWRAGRPPGPARRLAGGLLDWLRTEASLARVAARLTSSERRAELAAQLRRAAGALAHSARPAEPVEPLNQPISPARHLARLARPVADLRRVGQSFGATVNDVLLTASAGGVRRLLRSRDRAPTPLKTMVPVSVRAPSEADAPGNRISFVFVDLPCDEPDPVRRLRGVQAQMGERKQAGDPEGANALLGAVRFAPRMLQHAVSRLIASPRTFNLIVSNIPGPREPSYMLGCELREAYPVVPIADRHALAIGMTTVGDTAYFGLYADRDSLPDADRLAGQIDASIDELLEAAGETLETPPMPGVPALG